MNLISSGRDSSERAFQLKDLACALAVIGLLALIQVASLASGRAGSQADHCRNNLRRLIQAWQMYAEDNLGRLVPNNGSDPNDSRGTWIAGWLDFTSSFDNINTDYLVASEKNGRYGLLGPYVQRDFTVFRCPADTTTVQIAGRRHNRVRSVAMNNWMGGSAYCGGNGGIDYRAYQQVSEISAPAERWVISEQLFPSVNDSWYAIRLGDEAGGGFLIDYPGSHHSGGAWFNFADGHVAFQRWTDPRTMPPYSANDTISLAVPMDPANPDVAWLQEHASELR